MTIKMTSPVMIRTPSPEISLDSLVTSTPSGILNFSWNSLTLLTASLFFLISLLASTVS